MEDRNNYKKLRFDNDKKWKPNITQRELADRLGLGFSTICKLEKEGCNTASVSTIKAYKEYFLKEKHEDICYEYFMCKCQYKNVVFGENKSVGKPTSLFSTFLIIFCHILHLIFQPI